MELKILTFNWHEPYLCLLAHSGFEWHVLEPETGPGSRRRWDANMRPVPKNARIVSEAEARRHLEQGEYGCLVAHNLKDLAWAREYALPKIAVFHNKFSTEAGLSGHGVDRDQYLQFVRELTRDAHRVFISQSKQDDWGLDGAVILPGIPLDEYGGYQGDGGFVLRVGNHLMERDLMLGYSMSRQIVEGFPCVTLGQNPRLPGSRLSAGFEDLLDHYRRGRMFLNTTVEGYEDGYNLSMLEAMAVGMPVISTRNSTSPIEDGFNGYISHDLNTLRRRVRELLNDGETARWLGHNARQTVQRMFPIQAFIDNWRTAVQYAIHQFLNRHGMKGNTSNSQTQATIPRRNVLMDTNGNPVTTACYLERALRREHNVITCGSAFTEQHRKNWNMEALHWPVNQPDIRREAGEPIQGVLCQLPEGWQVDFYLYVETGLNSIPPDLSSLTIPRICYLIDTHLNFDNHLEIARHFDLVFLAQKEYVARFREAGIQKVEWLPLACDPEIHGKQETETIHDVGFVGSILPHLPRRGRLLEKLASHFKVHVARCFMKDMARVFSQSHIVFNNAVNNDLNMRVFEALCSGSLLVTDQAPGSGLADLFRDGEHLVVYEDEAIVETVRYYLEHPEEARCIAEQGRREVLAKHTYAHRVRAMMNHVEAWTRSNAMAEHVQPDASQSVRSYYKNVRHDLLPMVPESAQSILEVGCGAGYTGKALKDRQNAVVVGIEMNPQAAREAEQGLDEVLEGNIETMQLPYEEHSFDCILFADVLEHLVDPATVLRKTLPLLKPDGVAIASIPNVQYHGIVCQLGEGGWTYQDEGIMDRTHLRFFTLKEIQKMFAECGYAIERVEENLDPQYEAYAAAHPSTLKTGRVTISNLSPEELRRFFVVQYKICARPVQSPEPNAVGMGESLSIEDQLHRARELEDQGCWLQALDVYHTLLAEHPANLNVLLALGGVHARLGQRDEARNHLETILMFKPDHAAARALLEEIHNGHYQKVGS